MFDILLNLNMFAYFDIATEQSNAVAVIFTSMHNLFEVCMFESIIIYAMQVQ